MAFTWSFYKERVINAVFWTGVVALGVALLKGDFSFALFFVAVIAFNLVLALALRLLAPKAFEQVAQASESNFGEVGFRLTPLRYPKILDQELREFAPEFIRLDIKQNGVLVFSANLARDALRQLRDAVQATLEAKDVVAQRVSKQLAPQPQPQARANKKRKQAKRF